MDSITGARPLRSLLFVPGNKEDWMRKAPASGADALIFDLEDAVPPDQRPQARAIVRRMIEELGSRGQVIFVRINDMTTGEAGNDLEAVVCPQLHGIILPKVSGPDDVIAVSALLDHFERRSGVPHGQILVDPLLETALGEKYAFEVGKASPRVEYMGTIAAKDGDGARALGYEWTPEGTETLGLRQRGLLEARAAGMRYPLSGLWTTVGELEGLRKFAVQTRQIGYTGMMCIHPSHVPVINEVFSPTPEQIARWQEIVAGLKEAERQGTMAIRHRGVMVDIAHGKYAQERLEFARRLGLMR